MDKTPTTSIRLTAHARALAHALGDKLGLSRTATIEYCVRRVAEMEKVDVVDLPKRKAKACRKIEK